MLVFFQMIAVFFITVICYIAFFSLFEKPSEKISNMLSNRLKGKRIQVENNLCRERMERSKVDKIEEGVEPHNVELIYICNPSEGNRGYFNRIINGHGWELSEDDGKTYSRNTLGFVDCSTLLNQLDSIKVDHANDCVWVKRTEKYYRGGMLVDFKRLNKTIPIKFFDIVMNSRDGTIFIEYKDYKLILSVFENPESFNIEILGDVTKFNKINDERSNILERVVLN